MTELQDVALFCLFYSGVVMGALWLTVTQRPLRVPVESRRWRIDKRR